MFELFSQVVTIKYIYVMFDEPRFFVRAINSMDLSKRDKVISYGSFFYNTLLGRYLSKSISVHKEEARKSANMRILSGVVMWFQLNILVKI